MHIFIPAYVFLALASWSALAAPLSGSGSDNENAQKHSSSSILMSRQQIIDFGIGPIVLPDLFQPTSADSGLPSSTMDCDSMSQSTSQPTSTDDNKTDKDKTDSDKTNDHDQDPTTANTNPNPTPTGPYPAIARRRFPSPMRRGGNGSPDIFEWDDTYATGASNNPITVRDVLSYYLQQRAAARKRAKSPKTSRGFD